MDVWKELQRAVKRHSAALECKHAIIRWMNHGSVHYRSAQLRSDKSGRRHSWGSCSESTTPGSPARSIRAVLHQHLTPKASFTLIFCSVFNVDTPAHLQNTFLAVSLVAAPCSTLMSAYVSFFRRSPRTGKCRNACRHQQRTLAI